MTSVPVHRISPVLPVAAAIAIALVAVLAGVRTGDAEVDVDQAVYRDTLVQMRAGDGYYDAHRDALIAKEGAPPRSVRAIRPPTLFLALRWFPESSWRYLVGLAYLAILLAAWRLGEPYGRYGGVIAVVLAGLWVVTASSFLHLHAELWGAPLFLWGALEVRRGRDARAAGLVATATIVRELFGLGLLIGLVLRKQRAPWIAATLAVIALGVVHVLLAQDVLSPAGTQAALGNEPYTPSLVLTILSPGDNLGSWIVGIPMLVAGIAGLMRARRSDPAAAILLPFCAVMIPAAVVATRAYWSLTWGPAIAAFVINGIPTPRGPHDPALADESR
jgi:hypothetical protein